MQDQTPPSAEQLLKLTDAQHTLYRRVRRGMIPVKRALSDVRHAIKGTRPPRRRKPIPLVHDLFLPIHHQLRLVRSWNDTEGWGFTSEDFSIAEASVPEWPEDRLTAVVLVAYVLNMQYTFDLWWRIIESRYRRSWRWSGVVSDPSVLTTLDRKKNVSPILRWEVIDLGAWRGEPPRPPNEGSIRSCAHVGVLAAAALHRRWVWSMDGEGVPYVWIGGYRLYWPNDPGATVFNAKCSTPRLFWRMPEGKICLSSRWNSGDLRPFSTPRRLDSVA